MKILKIEHDQGFYFSVSSNDWNPIDQIDKNGLLELLDLYLENEAEMDSPDDNNVGNQAHAIIYRSIFDNLASLETNKKRFKDESERYYLEAIQKYSGNLSPDPLDP